MESKPLTSKYQAMSVFDYDSPVETKQEIAAAIHYCLHLLKKSKYMDHVSNFIPSLSKKKGK
jgi:hypothetical protein